MFPLETLPQLGDSNVLAPAGGLALILWLLWQAAKHYKEGRRIDVAAAEAREKTATQRADDLERELRGDIEKLRKEVAEVRDSGDREVAALRVRLNRISRQNYDLMQIAIQGGLGAKIEGLIDEDAAKIYAGEQ